MPKKKTDILKAGGGGTTEIGQLTPEQTQALMSVKDKQDMANSMMDSAYQMMIGIESILIEDHGFSTSDLEHFEMKIKRMLTTLTGLKKMGLTVLNYEDMKVVSNLAEAWLVEEKKKGEDKLLTEAAKKLKEGI